MTSYQNFERELSCLEFLSAATIVRVFFPAAGTHNQYDKIREEKE
jgi:hypothetical protein